MILLKLYLNFDNIIVTDIYAARETNRYGVSSQDLVDKINSLGKKAIYIQNFDDIINYLKENVKENDIILTLGAGTVTQISDKIEKILRLPNSLLLLSFVLTSYLQIFHILFRDY